MITIEGGSATTRQIVSMPDLLVMDARNDLGLVTLAQDTKLALLNLQTGQIKVLPASWAGDLGGGHFSPDGTQAVVEVSNTDGSRQLDLVTIQTGAVRTLLHIPNFAYNHAGLRPLRWVQAGILVTPGVWDLLPSQVYRLDPNTAALTLLTKNRVEVTSPAGVMLAAPNYLNLGDGEFHGQGQWPNQLVEGPINGGAETVVAQQKNRAFAPSDIADDGSLLYIVDGDFAMTSPASDMGLYFYRQGRSVRLMPESWLGEWSAWFVGQDLALAVKTNQTRTGSLEIDLIGLCTSGSSCTASPVPVLKFQGDYPGAEVLALD